MVLNRNEATRGFVGPESASTDVRGVVETSSQPVLVVVLEALGYRLLGPLVELISMSGWVWVAVLTPVGLVLGRRVELFGGETLSASLLVAEPHIYVESISAAL